MKTSATQPQLLQIPLDPGDVVYTPDWVAKDMVEFFNPSGSILEPCKGDGVFLKYLPPETEWCEITEGRDFFAWHEPVDWIIGNPPYKKYLGWFLRSIDISKDIVYLIPCDYAWNSKKMVETVYKWGGIKHTRIYGDARELDFPIHRTIGAIHFQRGYRGPMYTTIYGEP